MAGIREILFDSSNVARATDSDLLNRMSNKLNSSLNNSGAGIGSLYNGGVVGMSGDMSPLTNEIKRYVEDLNDTVNRFNATADISTALKGQAAVAAKEYMASIGELIKSYCSYYGNFINIAKSAQNQLAEGDSQNARAIREREESIRSDAKSILSEIGSDEVHSNNSNNTTSSFVSGKNEKLNIDTFGSTNYQYEDSATSIFSPNELATYAEESVVTNSLITDFVQPSFELAGGVVTDSGVTSAISQLL